MDASSHPKKIRKDTAKPERFDANTFGTLQEHVASHFLSHTFALVQELFVRII